MGFFDDLKEKLSLSSDDEYYDADYDDFYDEQSSASEAMPRGYEDEKPRSTSGVLGNTRRPEVNSVNVYTRGGKRVDSADAYSSASATSYMDEYNKSYPSSASSYNPVPTYQPVQDPNVIRMPQAAPDSSTGALPPYILRPVAYDDVQTVIRRVRTDQPVVLVFKKTNLDIAKRILDFCFGLTCGLDGSVEEIDDKVFVVLPKNRYLTRADKDHLASQGIIAK